VGKLIRFLAGISAFADSQAPFLRPPGRLSERICKSILRQLQAMDAPQLRDRLFASGPVLDIPANFPEPALHKLLLRAVGAKLKQKMLAICAYRDAPSTPTKHDILVGLVAFAATGLVL
jgi:hypothetical protein